MVQRRLRRRFLFFGSLGKNNNNSARITDTRRAVRALLRRMLIMLLRTLIKGLLSTFLVRLLLILLGETIFIATLRTLMAWV